MDPFIHFLLNVTLALTLSFHSSSLIVWALKAPLSLGIPTFTLQPQTQTLIALLLCASNKSTLSRHQCMAWVHNSAQIDLLHAYYCGRSGSLFDKAQVF